MYLEPKAIDINKFSSVIAERPASTVSSRYKFIPTTQALTVLADFGWFPSKITQANTRKEENEGFQRHVIRLNNEKFNREMAVGSTIPQLVLTNSHSGTAAFSFLVGLFEKVCSNGLIVCRSNFEAMRVTHSGYSDVNLANAIETTVKLLPDSLNLADSFKTIELTRDEQIAYAESAIELRYDGEKYAVRPDELLRTYRSNEKAPTLWNTYNVVQEKIINGGVRQFRTDGSRIMSRKIKNVGEDVKLNKALWQLTEKMAALKGFRPNA